MRRRHLARAAVAALLAAAATPAPAAAGPPAHCTEWWGSGTAAYPYPLGGLAHNLPECRVGPRGAPDVGSGAWALRDGHPPSMRRRLDVLEPNPDAGGRVSWPLLDSLGRTLAVLERRPDHWAALEPGTGRPIHADATLAPDVLAVQGRGCMADPALEDAHALVAFPAHRSTVLPGGESLVPYQLRAFLSRRALPARSADGRPLRDAVDLFRTGCGDDGPPAPGPARPLEDPAFGPGAAFRGEDGLARPYATYDVKGRYGGARYVVASTTGVHGGGIVRGVVRAGDPLAVADELGYCDPNAVGEPAARWAWVRVPGTRLAGWVARRCARPRRADLDGYSMAGSGPNP